MKKITVLIAFVAISYASFSQTPNSWRVGVSATNIYNPSCFSGGASGANALFSQEDFVSGALEVNGRYYYNKHWSLQSGLAFGQLGFQFYMTQDYSLMKKYSQFISNSIGVGFN